MQITMRWALAIVTVIGLYALLSLAWPLAAKAGHDTPHPVYVKSSGGCNDLVLFKRLIDMPLSPAWEAWWGKLVEEKVCFASHLTQIFAIERVVGPWLYEGDPTKDIVIVEIHDRNGESMFVHFAGTVEEFERRYLNHHEPTKIAV